MRQYRGAVCFVDVMGVGNLTRKRVSLTERDYTAHGITKERNYNEQYFCAKLLIKFRQTLNKIKADFKNIKVAQLSDSAFLWSNDPIQLIDAARACMWDTIRKGVLCRGGMAYGDIIEPDKINNSLGGFILGEAATKAVDMERLGKGCRIFTDENFPTEISVKKHFRHEPFIGLKNPTDCSITDEFRWYLFPDKIADYEIRNKKSEKVVEGLMELVSFLYYSPMFLWNVSSPEGQIHVASSIETISSCVQIYASELDFKISSESLIGFLDPNRSDKIMSNILKIRKREISQAFAQKKVKK